MGLSLVGLARKVDSRHMNPVCLVHHGPATSWAQHGQLRRDPPPLVEVEDSYRVGMKLVVVEN